MNIKQEIARQLFKQSFHPDDHDDETIDSYIKEWHGTYERELNSAQAVLDKLQELGMVIVPNHDHHKGKLEG